MEEQPLTDTFNEALKSYIIANPNYHKLSEQLMHQIIRTMIKKHPPLPGYTIQDLFFSNYMQDEKVDNFVLLFNHWEELGQAVLCRAILKDCSKIPNFLEFDINAIHRDAEFYTKELILTLYGSYAKGYVDALLQNDFMALFNDLPKAADEYKKKLIKSIPLHEMWYAYSEWQSPKMELFNHYCKLLNLGLSSTSIDAFIDELENNGLSIPEKVSKEQWRYFTGYFDKEDFLSYTYLSSISKDSRTGRVNTFEFQIPTYIAPLYYLKYQKKYIIHP